jgi:hypothetical protein
MRRWYERSVAEVFLSSPDVLPKYFVLNFDYRYR